MATKAGAAAQAVTSAHLTYYGGRVISNVRVVEVLYGTGTYLPEISGSTMGSFYSQVTNSTYMDWLSEYNTPAAGGTNQTIGRGSFQGKVQIAPSAAHSGPLISDSAVEAEIVAQIGAGLLPAPATDAAGNVNTLYMVHFPQGVAITHHGRTSCESASTGFCGYHSTFAMGGQHLYYAALPDVGPGSGCATVALCGTGAPFGNQTSVASHELIEAVTDPDIGFAPFVGPPMAWYDSSQAEIADICFQEPLGSILGSDGVTYTVQKGWSNSANACVVSRAAAPPTCAVSFSKSTVPSGDSVVFTLTSSGPIPTGSHAYLYGEKDGRNDVNGLDWGPPSSSVTLTNAFGLNGTYTRRITITDPNGQVACQTNDATVVFEPPKCAVSFSKSTVPSGGSTLFTLTSSGDVPIGSRAYLYGTKNGATDENGVDFGPPTFSYNLVNAFGLAGSYARSIVIRTPSNVEVCRTNTASTVFQAPTCQLSFSKSVVASGDSVQFALTSQGAIPAGTRAYLYGYKNGITDETGVDIGGPSFNYNIVNSPGLAGNYTRWVITRTTDGRTVCQTNRTSTIFQ